MDNLSQDGWSVVLKPGKVGTLLYWILFMKDSTRVVYK